jgi:hypothetical protein
MCGWRCKVHAEKMTEVEGGEVYCIVAWVRW